MAGEELKRELEYFEERKPELLKLEVLRPDPTMC